MAKKTDARPPPPVAVGHISLTVSDVNQATRFFETVGMRLIHLGQTTSVLELRGGPTSW